MEFNALISLDKIEVVEYHKMKDCYEYIWKENNCLSKSGFYKDSISFTREYIGKEIKDEKVYSVDKLCYYKPHMVITFTSGNKTTIWFEDIYESDLYYTNLQRDESLIPATI